MAPPAALAVGFADVGEGRPAAAAGVLRRSPLAVGPLLAEAALVLGSPRVPGAPALRVVPSGGWARRQR